MCALTAPNGITHTRSEMIGVAGDHKLVDKPRECCPAQRRIGKRPMRTARSTPDHSKKPQHLLRQLKTLEREFSHLIEKTECMLTQLKKQAASVRNAVAQNQQQWERSTVERHRTRRSQPKHPRDNEAPKVVVALPIEDFVRRNLTLSVPRNMAAASGVKRHVVGSIRLTPSCVNRLMDKMTGPTVAVVRLPAVLERRLKAMPLALPAPPVQTMITGKSSRTVPSSGDVIVLPWSAPAPALALGAAEAARDSPYEEVGEGDWEFIAY